MTKPRVLIWDIETLPNLAYCFDLWSYKKPDMLIKERAIISIAYKWLGDKKVQVIHAKKAYDDKALIERFRDVITSADYTVSHYGDKFDVRFLRGRVLLNKLLPIPHVPNIDTYKLAKKYFNLNANRLDYLGKVFGLGGKISTNWKLWERCANNEPAAIKEMAKYNKRDVDLLEKVFLYMLPHVESKLNHKLFSSKDACPNCGSIHVQKRGTQANKTILRQRFHCQDCGAWHIGKLDE